MIRVLIVDDHPVVRHLLRTACESSPRLLFVGEADRGAGAVRTCRRLRPDVMVLDLLLPDMDGLQVARALRHDSPRVGVLVLTGVESEDRLLESIRAGVAGYMRKTAPLEEVVDAIESVGRGEVLFSQQQAARAGDQLGREIERARLVSKALSSLTPRELEVLGFMCRGLSTRRIASDLTVSARTVEGHVLGACRKLEARNRTQAVARAVALGLVDPRSEFLPGKSA